MDIRHPGDLDFGGRRVTVVGLGIEGVDLARYLSWRGASVTVSDSKPAERLAARTRELNGLLVNLSLGSDQTRDICEAETVFVSQSVPLDIPGLRQAREKGIPMSSMLGLFMEICPGPIVGITGSSGKTTTTALVGEMFRADERPFFIGGNIGIGLLEHVAVLRPYTWAVLEISHTQLQMAERSPHVAAVLNITPNHLDRFSWDDYRRLKANIIRHQQAADTAVLNYDDEESRALRGLVKGRLLWFTMGNRLPGDGVLVRNGMALLRCGKLEEPLFALRDLTLRGAHNQANAVAAAAIASACGVSPDAIACAVASFRGVPHRLELVARVNDASYYNDSIATTPERTLAGIRSFDEPIVLFLGGRDKHLPLEELAAESLRRCRAIVLFGEAAGKIEDALRRAGADPARIRRAAALPEAVQAASKIARPGDIVLMSPACTSFDAYDNFEQRGEHFRALVRAMIKEVEPSLP